MDGYFSGWNRRRFVQIWLSTILMTCRHSIKCTMWRDFLRDRILHEESWDGCKIDQKVSHDEDDKPLVQLPSRTHLLKDKCESASERSVLTQLRRRKGPPVCFGLCKITGIGGAFFSPQKREQLLDVIVWRWRSNVSDLIYVRSHKHLFKTCNTGKLTRNLLCKDWQICSFFLGWHVQEDDGEEQNDENVGEFMRKRDMTSKTQRWLFCASKTSRSSHAKCAAVQCDTNTMKMCVSCASSGMCCSHQVEHRLPVCVL